MPTADPLAFTSQPAGPGPVPTSSRWIFSRRTDLVVFGGTAVLALALAVVGEHTRLARVHFPTWAWIVFVVFVDVAHVWSTLFRVYLDPVELARRPWLYFGAPLAAYLAGVALCSHSQGLFWSVLAYVAVFHFVRQQYGWVAIYRRLEGTRAGGRADAWLDTFAVYVATLYPLAYWHAHLPRAFHWFVDDDFVVGLAGRVADVGVYVYASVLGAWAARSVWRWVAARVAPGGRALVLVTTALCWYVGIVGYDSDWSFTVTNVLIHGVPYMVLLWLYSKRRFVGVRAPVQIGPAHAVLRVGGVLAFLALLWALAWVEEGWWDVLFWHERPWMTFGWRLDVDDRVIAWVMPLLTVPQATHYVLDGWIWRAGRDNPELLRDLGFVGAR